MLKKENHKVSIFTSHHDKNNCFTETKDDTIDMFCAGSWPLNSLGGYYRAQYKTMKIIFLVLYARFILGLE